MKPVIEIHNLVKTFGTAETPVPILKGVHLTVHGGDFVGIVGASGSGKSTFLNIIACLDRPTSGTYFLGDANVALMEDADLSRIRNQRLGFVFQSFNLINQLTALENVELPLFYRGIPKPERTAKSKLIIEKVGMGHRFHHFPKQLSGGESQRIAIARALVGEPLILLADEPTGNLDSKTGEEIMKLFWELNRQGSTIVMVTHDRAIADSLPRQVRMKDGLIETVTQANPA